MFVYNDRDTINVHMGNRTVNKYNVKQLIKRRINNEI